MSSAQGDRGLGGEVKVIAAVAIAGIVGVTALVFTSGDDKPTPTPTKVSEKDEAASADAKDQADPTAKFETPPPPPPLDQAVIAQRHRESQRSNAEQLEARQGTVDTPPDFDTKEDEKAWWNEQLSVAKELTERRQAAVDDLPRHEALIAKAANPEKSRELFERKKARLEEQLEAAKSKVSDIESKLAGL